MRYALIHTDAHTVRNYIPANYAVLWEGADDHRAITIIYGRDHAGWTLTDYVLPRLASGLYFGQEIDLSHPLMKQVPA